MKRRRIIIDIQTTDDVKFSDILDYVKLLVQSSKLSGGVEAIELKERGTS